MKWPSEMLQNLPFFTGVNISQKNWNYSVMGLRKFQNYSELLKIILSNKVQNLCFGIIFVDFWGQFLVSKRNINLILVKFDINVDFLRKNSEKSLEFQKLFRKQSSCILRNIYPCNLKSKKWRHCQKSNWVAQRNVHQPGTKIQNGTHPPEKIHIIFIWSNTNHLSWKCLR